MDNREQKTLEVYKDQWADDNALQTSSDLVRNERNTIMQEEYKAALGIILELHESLSKDDQPVTLNARTTRVALEIANITVQHDNGGASEAPPLVEHSAPFNSQDYKQRFSQLTERLNDQLCGFLETSRAVIHVTDQLTESVDALSTGVGAIEDELHNFNLESKPKS